MKKVLEPTNERWVLEERKIANGEELHIHIKITEITKVIYLNQWDPSVSTDQFYGINPSEQPFLIVETEPIFKSKVFLQLNRTIDHVR